MADDITAPDESGTVDDGVIETPTPDFGGYGSLEELLESHAKTQERVADLDTLRGRQGSELAEYRTKLASLEGQIKGIESSRAATPSGPTETISDIQRLVDSGEITQGEAISKYAAIAQADYDKRLDARISTLKTESDREKYVANFIKENPDYEGLYESGELHRFINAGLSGEQAYDRYHREKAITELNKTKQELETKIKEAQEAGKQEGLRLAKGNSPASRVIGSQNSGITDLGPGSNLSDPRDRMAHAKQRLAELRGHAP